MNSLQRPRSHTTSEDDQDSNKEHPKSRGSFSKETKLNKRISLPPGFNQIFVFYSKLFSYHFRIPTSSE